jgi:glucokinase
MASTTKKRIWLGFDLGGTKMMATVFDHQFNPLGYRRKKSKRGGSAAGVTRILETIDEALESAKVDARRLAGIGIGCPGLLDLNRGIVIKAPNLGWINLPLKTRIERKFDCPVTVVNDVDAGTYGEYKFGAGQQERCVVGVFPGTGVGGGCVYEGKLIRGKVSSCMEIGHMHFQHNGHLCGCGRSGCVETVTSRLGIAADAAVAAHRGQAPHLYEHAGTDLSAIRSSALASAIKDGDTAIEGIVRRAAHDLGIAIASMVNLLAPDVVVLGGGLVEAMPRLYVEEVRRAVREQAMRTYAQSTRVVAAKLGDDATVMGAAALASEAVAGAKRGLRCQR